MRTIYLEVRQHTSGKPIHEIINNNKSLLWRPKLRNWFPCPLQKVFQALNSQFSYVLMLELGWGGPGKAAEAFSQVCLLGTKTNQPSHAV